MRELQPKRAYKTPTLVVHGSIETITLYGYQQGFGLGGNNHWVQTGGVDAVS